MKLMNYLTSHTRVLSSPINPGDILDSVPADRAYLIPGLFEEQLAAWIAHALMATWVEHGVL